MNHIPTERSVEYSKTTITELMVPMNANFGGKIHGGHILSLIDKVAYACASKFAGTYCVTLSVDTVNFYEPIEVGELVSFHASVNYVGKTSLNVGIKVVAENFRKGIVRHTNTCYVTMVAVDEEGKKQEVPKLILENEVDVKRFLKALKRKEQNILIEKENRNSNNAIVSNENLKKLNNQRCVLAYNIKND